jgi:hypothetical protein
MKRRLALVVALAVLLAVSITTTLTLAQGPTGTGPAIIPQTNAGTAFTYQGQLKHDGSPVNGTCDFEFGLWDSSSGGLQVSDTTTQTVPSVTVTNGLFTASIDFGASAFNGDARWLDIQVNCTGAFVPLTRQAVTAAPYSLFALSTGALQGRSITTTAPATGQVLKWNGSVWAPAGDAIGWSLTGNGGTDASTSFLGTTDNVSLSLRVNNAERMLVGTNGNVGIGTSAPAAKLTLQGNQLIKGEDAPVAVGATGTNLIYAFSVYVSGKYAYVADYNISRFAIFDVSDPVNIVAKGFTSANINHPQSLYVAGKYAYVASTGNNRLAIFDVSDPVNIVASGFISTNLNYPQSVYVAGRYAYVASTVNSRLAIFDVSDPVNIVARGFTSANLSSPNSVYVAGKYAYVSSQGDSTLAVFDVSDADNIVAKGFTSASLSSPKSVYVSGSYAYVASRGNNGLAIFDVSNANNIVAKGFTSLNLEAPESVYVAGKYAYVASYTNSRLAVFDVSDPVNIVAKGFTSSNLNHPKSVHVSGKYAYVASWGAGALAIFELNNLDTPTLAAGSISSGGLDVTDNAVVGANLYVQGGLSVGPGGALVDGDLSAAALGASSLRISGGVTFTKIQAGAVTLGPGIAGVNVYTVTFPSAFSATPRVTATVNGEAGAASDDLFVLSVRAKSTTQFQVNVYRIDNRGGTWTQNINVDWIAWE